MATKPIQNSTNTLVWMNRMIICTFRKNLGKIRVDVEFQYYSEIKIIITPTSIQNSSRDLVWMYRMIICTFRRNLGKTGSDIPSHFNIISQKFLKIFENRPKKEIRKFIAPTQNQYRTLQTTLYGCIG